MGKTLEKILFTVGTTVSAIGSLAMGYLIFDNVGTNDDYIIPAHASSIVGCMVMVASIGLSAYRRFSEEEKLNEITRSCVGKGYKNDNSLN